MIDYDASAEEFQQQQEEHFRKWRLECLLYAVEAFAPTLTLKEFFRELTRQKFISLKQGLPAKSGLNVDYL